MASVIIRPSGVGTNTDFSTIFGAATTWQCVNEVVADNDLTYIATAEGGEISSFAHTAAGLVATDTISSVIITVDCRFVLGVGIISNQFSPLIWLNGSGFNDNIQSLTTSYQTISYTYLTNPDSGLAWTKAAVDSMEIGVFSSVTSAGGTETVRCTQIYATVNYTSSVSLPTTIRFLMRIGS